MGIASHADQVSDRDHVGREAAEKISVDPNDVTVGVRRVRQSLKLRTRRKHGRVK
jgi:hypothetical protein